MHDVPLHGSRAQKDLTIMINFVILFIAAFLAGTLNSVAGGGSFIGFPALVYTNVPTIQANTTNTMALWPGSLAAAWALRKELFLQNRTMLLILGITSLVGGTGGAYLLLSTPQATFEHLIPFLMLAATLLFAVSPLVNARVKELAAHRQKILAERRQQAGVALPQTQSTGAYSSKYALAGIALLQLIISIYGGYFGGGIGILMLAALGVMGMENIHEMNAVKNALATCINGVAVVIFILRGAIVWPDALLMIVAAIIGGYGGAYYARKLDPRFVRVFVILVGCTMTLYFFYKFGFF